MKEFRVSRASLTCLLQNYSTRRTMLRDYGKTFWSLSADREIEYNVVAHNESSPLRLTGLGYSTIFPTFSRAQRACDSTFQLFTLISHLGVNQSVAANKDQ